jgi:hypothetical protein
LPFPELSGLIETVVFLSGGLEAALPVLNGTAGGRPGMTL